MSIQRLSRLIQAIRDHGRFDHPVERFELLETHLSYVLLTGCFAYKFKKPLRLSFVDFSDLAKRKHACDEELRLNRRLAPAMYLDVIAITGSDAAPTIGGAGRAIEYCVKMRQFDQRSMLDQALEHGQVSAAHFDALAVTVAQFHLGIATANASSPYGTAEQVGRYAMENFTEIGTDIGNDAESTALSELRAWTAAQLTRLRPLMIERKAKGFVRECHGDMHVSNMVLIEDRIVVFDCIEFNPDLYWIDVISEIAFLLMDLDLRDRPDLAHRFLNLYLEVTGDYGALALLAFYKTYRSIVRAKVAAIGLRQASRRRRSDAAAAVRFSSHIALASGYAVARRGARLLITHGLSGSGKTFGTEPLVERFGCVRLRSDVERKRLNGLTRDTRSGSRLGGDLYRAEMTAQTYHRLHELAHQVLAAGFSVIVDATFLKRAQRETFRRLAQKMDVPFRTLSFSASPERLSRRILEREQRGTDASEAGLAVLQAQLQLAEPLGIDELADAFCLDTEHGADLRPVIAFMTPRLSRETAGAEPAAP